MPRIGKHEHRYLSHEQVDDLAAATGYPSDPSKFSSLDTRENETYVAVIVESVTPVQGQGLVWGTTKTHQRREVPIPRFLATELAEHIRGKKLDDLVFAGIRHGQPLRVSTFRTAFSAAARAIGVPDLHPHQLRHTAASLAIASGADVKVIQHILGHSSATMTLDTYGRLFEDRLDEVGSAMDAARTRAQARRRTSELLLRVAPCCPSPSRPDMPKGPLPAFALLRAPLGLVPPTGFEPALPP